MEKLNFLIKTVFCASRLIEAFFCGVKLILKMNGYSLQQNAYAACEEMRGIVNLADQKEPIICPKPRRVGVLSNIPMGHMRLHFNQQDEGSDSNAGAELLDIMLKNESHGDELANQVASSPPFFCGSPPVRAANPLVQDDRFGDEKHAPMIMMSSPSGLLSPSSTLCKGGCVRMSFGLKPAAVRVEGFDCLNKDHQNSRILAVA
ncbi:hypothetical protein VNO77_35010 [Canavalia gladiata]|uniref:Uncharacterized protein n=1 Tax=Canavalia gladiata TaxID=3824 RepID=A0AAN9PXJ0_CANGL